MAFLGWLRDWLALYPGGRDVGRRGEKAAADYLRRQGLRIIARNVRGRGGEIDLLAVEGSTLVFVEVKSRTWRPGAEVTGLEKIGDRKLQALRRVSAGCRKRFCPESYRLDAVTVEFEDRPGRLTVREVRWYPAIADLDAM